MDQKLFIIFTADDCSACQIFKQHHLESLKILLSKLPKLNIKFINVKSMNDNIDSVHPQLNLARKSFPGFYLFDRANFMNGKSTLSGHVMGGHFKNGNLERDPSAPYSYRAVDIIKWLQPLLKSTKKFISDNDDIMNWYTLFS